MNEFALDDGIVIIKNEYVQQGFGGIKKILSTDAYDSFYRQMNAKDQLSGGRYRPLSIVTFAIEHSLFGENWQVRHFFNVVWFLASLVAMLYFLRLVVFPNKLDVAFLTTLLFAIHPIHTEVIANVKSRDEIMSLLFILLTLIYSFQYSQNPRIKNNLFKGLGFFFLSLLSKEYAITLVVIIPIMIYLFSKREIDFSETIGKVVPFVIVVVVYLIIRFSIVVIKADVKNDEVLNNPYLFAHGSQVIATKISNLFSYIKLLFVPYPLSADYSYNQIPYKSLSHWSVWASLATHLGMLYMGIKWFKERHPLAFAVAFYFGMLALVANIVFDIGATMGERLIYHSSFGFCMIIAYYIIQLFEKQKQVALAICIALTAVGGYATIQRNSDWKNDITLFTKDVETVPFSALANGNAGARWIDLSEMPENKAKQQEYLNKALGYLNKSITIHPKYVNSYLNLGLTYYKLGDLQKAKQSWDKAKEMYPNNPYLKQFYPLLTNGYLSQCMELGKQQKLAEAIDCMKNALQVDGNNAEIWYNLGGAYFTVKDYANAKAAWEKTLLLDPNHQQAKQGLGALTTAPAKQ